ncbi:MAG TPA: 16S rRNA (adenine(1518)-N(6)/adenine(1519)-N(6))-dimethyltransferase RsmA [Candidatus Acidoferrales bacterium]|nr:16S rRNA (adenine(1518)-N(6)/adenine(1519)-N(6))-dimethyltransferase RsmA [Candidatus Acidoferrales bacterium]
MKKPFLARSSRNTGASSRPAPALAIAGVRPSKSRGQNFLTSGAIAARIVAAAEIGAGDAVLEIGPGLGILTEKIVAHPFRRLTVVELDSRLAAGLHGRLAAGRADIRIVNADFLSLDFSEVAIEPPLKVIGNLPFNVAAAILRRLCDNASAISQMVLMFQREVALRIRARPGDDAYGALSVFTALYWDVAAHFIVAAGSFHPRPKVDAEVLTFKPRATPAFAPHEERAVLEVVRASFSAPRKTIRNSLSHGLEITASEAVAALERAAIDPGARAETLDVADFVRLARTLGARPSPEIIEKNA